MLAVGLLFYALVYLTMGGLVSVFLRFKGLPEIGHAHGSDCYEMIRANDSVFTLQRGRRICNPRLGGKPFELILWIIWTIVWPVPVIMSLLFVIGWLFYKGLWIKF